jgi:hypothetical protein
MNEQGSKIRIANAIDFLKLMVEPDYLDFLDCRTDMRHAFHLACSLFHLRDWVLSDYGQSKGWGDPRQLQRFLESTCTDFQLIRDIANSSKHLNLERASTPITTATATFATITPHSINGTYDSARRYQGGSEILVTVDRGDPLRFELIAKNVFEMWKVLFEAEGWR